MSLINSETKQEVQDEFKDLENYVDDNNKSAKAVSSWGISITLHALALIIFGTIVFAKELMKEKIDIHITVLDPPPAKEEKIKERSLLEKPNTNYVEHNEKVIDNITIISELDIKDSNIPESEDIDDNNSIKGRDNAISDKEFGGPGFMCSIGAGGDGGGKWGRPQGGDKMKMRKYYGPNAQGAMSAIDAALKFLVVHQSPDGRWDSDNYFINCQDGGKCEPGKEVVGADEAMTGYSCLSFLGAGYTHKHGSKYKKTVKAGIEWILSVQKPDGLIGTRNYEHAVCTMALSEAYGMTNDQSLKDPAQKAIDIILNRQTPDPTAPDQAYAGLGWDYINPNPSRNDSSLTGWCVMALKAGKAAGLDVKGGLEGSKKWLEGAWKASNPNWQTLSPYDKSVFPYTWSVVDNKINGNHLSFIGALCAVFMGYKSGEPILDTLINDMTIRWYDSGKYKNNSYALYYASLSSFQHGGKTWDKWAEKETGYVKWLINTQFTTNDCFNGTWKNEEAGWHGGEISRVLIHNYKLLALEVAFRFVKLK